MKIQQKLINFTHNGNPGSSGCSSHLVHPTGFKIPTQCLEDVKKFITTTNLTYEEIWEKLYGKNPYQLYLETQKSQVKPKNSKNDAKNQNQVDSWQL